MVRAAMIATLSLLGGLLGACSGGGDTPAPDAGYNCELETRDDEFIAGIEKVSDGGVAVRIMESTPAPPVRGDNVFQLELAGPGGAPLTGNTVKVTPFMPDHQHGSPIAVEVTAGAADGEYQAAPVNLWMPGLWEITVDATPDGGGIADRERVVFRFCIAE